jgi:hypothetical protein
MQHSRHAETDSALFDRELPMHLRPVPRFRAVEGDFSAVANLAIHDRLLKPSWHAPIEPLAA